MKALASTIPAAPAVKSENEVPGMSSFLDSLKYNQDHLVAVIVQVGLLPHGTAWMMGSVNDTDMR